MAADSTGANDEVLSLTIETAIRIALSNNQLIRRDADFIAASNPLLANPQQEFTTLYAAIQDSGYLYGSRGAAAALSEFDSRLGFRTTWGRNESVQNNLFLSGGIVPGGALVEETAQSVIEISRNMRSGGRMRLFHTVDYDASNRQDLLYPSAYRLALGAEVRQPLLAGAGRDFTDAAGPPDDLVRGVTGVSQGVLIARNRTTLAKLELQRQARELITDIEKVYWESRQASEAAVIAGQLVAQIEDFQQRIQARIDAQGDASRLDKIAIDELALAARQLELEQRESLNDSRHRLTRLLGISKLTKSSIEFADPMFEGFVIPDLKPLQQNAVARRVELRQQVLRIRQLDLQLRAAQSLLLPQLDGIASYQVNGFGDSLVREVVPAPDEAIQSAYRNLGDGDFTGWQLGFVFSHRFGRRLARTQIRNLRLQAQRERIILREQEVEIEQQVSALIDRVQTLAKRIAVQARRVELASDRFEVTRAIYESNGPDESLISLAEASYSKVALTIELLRLRSRYCQALADLRMATESIVKENGIHVR